MSYTKEAKHAARRLRKRPGWTALGWSGRGHFLFKHVSGALLTFSCSPSDRFWLVKHEADVARIERGAYA